MLLHAFVMRIQMPFMRFPFGNLQSARGGLSALHAHILARRLKEIVYKANAKGGMQHGSFQMHNLLN